MLWSSYRIFSKPSRLTILAKLAAYCTQLTLRPFTSLSQKVGGLLTKRFPSFSKESQSGNFVSFDIVQRVSAVLGDSRLGRYRHTMLQRLGLQLSGRITLSALSSKLRVRISEEAPFGKILADFHIANDYRNVPRSHLSFILRLLPGKVQFVRRGSIETSPGSMDYVTFGFPRTLETVLSHLNTLVATAEPGGTVILTIVTAKILLHHSFVFFACPQLSTMPQFAE